MNELEVRIVRLDPMRMATFQAYGPSPENAAGSKLINWAAPRRLLEDPHKHRIFGFDNPGPSPGSENYGYEYWIEVGPDENDDQCVKFLKFPGGLFAVTRCEVRSNAYTVIPQSWKALAAWRENSRYESGDQYWLEEQLGAFRISDDFTLDLYFPIIDWKIRAGLNPAA